MQKSKTIAAGGVLLLLSLFCAVGIGFTSEAKEIMTVFCSAGVNVRSGPGTEYDIIGSYESGDDVEITGQEGDWCKINYNGETGYIYNTLLYNEDTDQMVVVAKMGVNIRSDASMDAEVIGGYDYGEVVTIVGEKNGWCEIYYQSQTGYIYKDNLAVATGRTTAENEQAKGEKDLKVNCKDGLNIRAKADAKSDILGVFNYGETVHVTGKSGDWYTVSYNGTTAFCYSEYLE